MRITNKMMTNDFLNDMQTNLQNMSTIQQQMSSGKEISKPSDDPFKTTKVLQLQSNIADNNQYKTNIQDASDFLSTTDTALGQANDVLQRINELLVSAGNAGYTQDERSSIKDEINQDVGQLAQVLNTNFDGKYIFGGTRATTKPVDVLNPVTTSVGSVTASAGAPAGSITGTYTGSSSTNYEVKLVTDTSVTPNTFKGYQLSTDGGSTWQNEVDFSSAKAIDSAADVDLGQGITLHVAADSNNNIQNNSVYSFATTVSQPSENSQLIYYDKSGGAIPDPLQVQVPSANLANWAGASIGFNIAGSSQDITIPAGTQINSIDDLAAAVNSAISANTSTAGKINAEVVKDDSGNSCLRFENLTSSDITLQNPSTGTLPSDLSSSVGSKVTDSQLDMIKAGLNIEISQGVVMQYSASAADVIQFTNDSGQSEDLRSILTKIVNHLDGKNDDGTADDSNATSELTNSDLQAISDAISNVSKVQSEVGAKEDRMSAASDKNDTETTNLTEILSNTEDIDVTEKTMEYATAQTVYMAALQTSARVIQPSLMDYLK